ncbi:sulfotransferase 1C4-like [Leptidea sinapis]|uniref:sulfotransferase 1C4-like n=1 Tax=Leptidea sinapis TaxID=189913 RepID=UPI00212F4D31|nr:sulfotransferase 1C4-like [Leptidea sinapis]
MVNIPFEIQDVSDEDHQLIWNVAKEKRQYVQVGPSKYFYPKEYEDLGPICYNFKIRPDDVFVVNYPRSGSTWLSEMIWLINNNLDYATAKSVDVGCRFPLMDVSVVKLPKLEKERIKSLAEEERSKQVSKYFSTLFDEYSNITTRRFFKTHLPLSLLPPDLLDKAKVVYIARDPRDVFVSVYHLLKNRIYDDKPDEIWNLFRRGLLPWCPVFPHVKEGWVARDNPNLLFIFYEDVVNDLQGSLRRMASFFGKDLTDEQIHELCEHLRFDNIKKNEAVNQQETMAELGVCSGQSPFIRKGLIGDWRDHFSKDQAQEAEEWMRENISDSELKYSTF